MRPSTHISLLCKQKELMLSFPPEPRQRFLQGIKRLRSKASRQCGVAAPVCCGSPRSGYIVAYLRECLSHSVCLQVTDNSVLRTTTTDLNGRAQDILDTRTEPLAQRPCQCNRRRNFTIRAVQSNSYPHRFTRVYPRCQSPRRR